VTILFMCVTIETMIKALPTTSQCRFPITTPRSGRKKSARRFFRPRDSARVSYPPPRRSRKKCLPLSTSRRFNTSSKSVSLSGIEHIIIVTGKGKNSIEDHFDSAPALNIFWKSGAKKIRRRWFEG